MKKLTTIFFIFLTACNHKGDVVSTIPEDSNLVGKNAIPIKLWSTRYFAVQTSSVPEGTGVPIRNMKNRKIGPEISKVDWCQAAIEGTVRVDDKITFNYAGIRGPIQAKCRLRSYRKTRWVETKNEFGTGSKSNALVPFKSIACDLGTVAASQPWLNGGYADFGDIIFIPSAVGTKLPNGDVHDGYFTCADVGGKITGNHIDLFVGPVRGGDRGAAKIDPFKFTRSSKSKPFDAVLIKKR